MKPKKSKPKWKLVFRGEVLEYKCGLHSGDRLRVIAPIVVRDHNGIPTGGVHEIGEVWIVVPGSREDPVLFMQQPDGKLHTWDDDLSVFETFEVVGE